MHYMGPENFISQNQTIPPSQNQSFTTNDYQKYLQEQRFMTYEPKEAQTPGLSQNHNFLHPPNTRQSQEKDRSISTGFKPTTAVRLKSLPWNFA